MSDVKSSGGKSATKAAAPARQTWEARVEAARKQREIALARNAREDPDVRPESPANEAPDALDGSTLERVVARQTRPDLVDMDVQPEQRRRVVPMVAAAALCAAALTWAASEWGPAFSGFSEILSDGPNLKAPTFALNAHEPVWDAGIHVVSQEPAPIIFFATPSAYRPLEPQAERLFIPNASVFEPAKPQARKNTQISDPPFVGDAPQFAGLPTSFDGFVLDQITPTPAALTSDFRPIVVSSQPPSDSRVPVALPEPVLADGLPSEPDLGLSGQIGSVEDLRAEAPEDVTRRLSIVADVSLFVPNRVSEETGARALSLLNGGRANVVDTARVGYSVRNTQVRYYHAQDAAVAGLAAEALGGISRDFTSSDSKTRPGHIEVYLAGNAQRATRNTATRPSGFEQFLARILNAAN